LIGDLITALRREEIIALKHVLEIYLFEIGLLLLNRLEDTY
jgi:hypothetical protein